MTLRMALVGVVVSAGMAAAIQKPFEVKLSFVPQDSVLALAKPLPPSIIERPAEIRVEDSRVLAEPLDIGEGNDGDTLYPIRSEGDPIKFVRDSVLRVTASQGLANAKPGDRQFRVRVVRFWVGQFHKAVGAMYVSEVTLAYSLTDKTGKLLVEGANAAAATRYGKARSGANCSEVLSDALKEAILKILDDPRLRAAWESGGLLGSARPFWPSLV